MNPRFLLILLAIAPFVGLGVLFTTTGLRADPAPAWSLPDVNGKTVQLSDFKGRVVVLDFWATWCPPCLEEIPHFVELQNRYQGQKVTFVGVSLDSTGPKPVADFVQRKKINYPIVMGTQEMAEKYGVQGIPATYVIDGKGRIVAMHVGFTDPSVFEGDIKKALAESGPGT